MGFFAALEFLTRLRLRRTPPGDLRRVAAAQGWFPAIGLILGALLLGTDRLASRALPATSVDVLLVVALAALTGGLHLDGLGDAADGMLGGRDREQRLAIMRDVHAGSYAVIAIAGVLALKWAGLAAMPRAVRFESLLLVPCLARMAMVMGAAAFPYARNEGMGAAFHGAALPAPIIVAGATAVAASVVLLGAGGLIAAVFAACCALAVGAWARQSIGGMTGDLYGATAEIAEAGLFLLIAALAGRGWIEPLLLS